MTDKIREQIERLRVKHDFTNGADRAIKNAAADTMEKLLAENEVRREQRDLWKIAADSLKERNKLLEAVLEAYEKRGHCPTASSTDKAYRNYYKWNDILHERLKAIAAVQKGKSDE